MANVHKDFHGCLSYGLKFLAENYGRAEVEAYLRRVARKRLRDTPIPSRWTTALGLDRGFVGLFGGYGESFLDEVFVYDTERNVYLPCAGLPQPLAVMAGGLGEQETVYLAGGEDRARHRSASLLMGRLSSRKPY